MVRKLSFKYLLIFILLTSIASADDMGQLQSDTIFNFSAISVNITVLAPQNFSQIQFPASPPNTLEFTINGSTIQFNSTADKTISGINYSGDVWQWSTSTNGFINVTTNSQYNFANYSLYKNTTLISTNLSDSTGNITFNTSSSVGANFSVRRAAGTALISPANGSSAVVPSTFPYSQAFTWSDESSNLYQIQTFKDSGLSIKIKDITVTQNSTSFEVIEAAQYYWRVRTFDGVSTYGTWSLVFNFELTAASYPSSTGTTGVQGIVYEVKSSGNVPITNAIVTLWNSSDFQTATTTSTGYFLFEGLANNSVYSLKATKSDYVDSPTHLVTTINGSWVVEPIYMTICTGNWECRYNKQQVFFTIINSAGVGISDVNVVVKKYGETDTFDSGDTDTQGTIGFDLEKTQKYTITFTKAAIGLSMTTNLIPENTAYVYKFSTGNTYRETNISWNLSYKDNNATTIYLNITYTDLSGGTSQINFFVKNRTGTVLFSNTTNGAISSYSNGFAVNNTAGLFYYWGFNATHSTFGLFEETNVMQIRGRLIDLKLDNEDWYTWISVALIVFVAALFSFTTNKYGYIIIPFFSGFLWAIDWLEIAWGLVFVTIILGILAFLSAKEKQEGLA